MSLQPPSATGGKIAGVPPPRVSDEWGPGGSIAGFEVVAELGRGAQSRVFRVRRLGGGADSPEYALKVLDCLPSGSGQALVAFRREAALLASVDHPGLTAIHEVSQVEGRAYLVMDLVEGVTLAELLAGGALLPERVISLARDVVGPLAAVHRRGLVHRDLKPNNIMILPGGQARLIDFGLATRESSDQGQSAVGTLMYSPPEQTGMLKRPVDNRSDLYSLGVVLFECLTGAPLFAAAEVGELLRMHAVSPPPDLLQLLPGIPVGLAAAVARLLAKDPDDRYQNGEELAADLRLLAEGPQAPVDARGAGGLFDGPARVPLSGRARELAQLASRWDATRGGTGRACVVRGPGGGGKSRLVMELAARAGEQGAVVVHGKSSPDDPVPLAPLRSALEGYLDAVGRFPQDERDRVHDLVRAAAGPAAGLLGGLTPGLGALLGVSHRVDGQDQFTLAVVGFLTDLACACGGLLLVLDDVQWLDPGTARVLASLSGALDGVPLMVVVTARNDQDSAAAADTLVASLGGAVDLDLELAPLDESGVAELVRTLMPGLDTANSLARLLAVRSSGNPFVVLEYLRAIVDAGLLRPCWGTWLLDEDALDTLELPQDALGLVLTRVRGLGLPVRELLVTAAAVGARFRPQLVAAVQGVDLDVVLAAAVEAAGHGLVEPREGGEFAFLHDRIREALHDELDAAGSARLHQRIAAALQAMPVPAGGHAAGHVYAVAHHYMAGEAGSSSELAFAACWAAGQLALDDYAPADAVAFLQYAAGIGGATDGRFLLVFGSALKQNGQYAEARRRLEQAVAVETAPASRARILTMLADTHRASWHIEQAVAAVEQGLAELGAPLPRNPLRLALSTAVMFAAAQLMRWTGWRFGSARGDERLRCTLIAGLHEVGVYVGALNTRPEQVIMHSLRALYWVNRIGEGAQYARSQGSLGFFYAMLGLPRTSERAFARVAADPAGSEPGVRALTASSRGAALCLGYHDNGEAWIRGLEQYGQWLDLATYCDSLTTLTLDAVSQGRLPEATRWLALGQRRLTLRVGELSSMSLSLITPTVHAIMGRPGEAAGMLRRAEEQLGDECPLGMAVLRQLVRLAVLREQDEVGEPFDRAVSDFEGLGLSAALLVRSNRVVHFHIAMGRLAQCRAATGDDRTVRLTAARDAVRALRKARKGQELRARERIARADLHVLEGEPGKALTVLERGDPIQHPDAPLLAYESARVRARALAALGGAEQSRRQALLALAIAEDSGWPHRAGWVTAEFGSVAGRSTGTSIQMTGYHRGDPGASATVRSSRIAGSVGSVGGSSSAAVGMERQRLAALQQVSAAASRVLDPGALARIALDETIRILAADRAFLFLTGGDDLLVPHLGRDAAGHDVTDLTGYSASLVARVHRTREPLVVTGTQEGAALGAQSVVLHGLRSIMVAPLQLEGRLLGVVYLDSQVAKGIFTADDVGILLALTNHIATSLETARAAQLEISVRTVQRQRDLADTLREALESMADTIEPQQVLARLLSWAVRVVGCDHGWLLADDGHSATLSGLAPNGELSTRAVDRDPGMAVLLGSELPVLGSAATVPPPLHAQLSGATSWIALPLRSGQAVLGVLILAARTPEVRLQEHVEVASALVAQGMTAHDRASLFTQVQLLAVADELTGIANRRHFFEVAERDVAAAAAADRPLTALMVDIDHFKAVNDTYGHPTGDDVIRTVAQRLAAVIRQTDLVGRYGGEEFAVILPDADLGSDLPERLRACIADVPVQTRSGPLPVSVSIGLAHLRPDDADVATVLARADQALYRAKQEGRNRVHTA